MLEQLNNDHHRVDPKQLMVYWLISLKIVDFVAFLLSFLRKEDYHDRIVQFFCCLVKQLLGNYSVPHLIKHVHPLIKYNALNPLQKIIDRS